MAVEKSTYKSVRHKLPSSVAIFPYFNGKLLLVAASLNGGNVLAHFVQMIQSWHRDLFNSEANDSSHEETIWSKLIQAGLDSSTGQNATLVCKPTLFGERHAKETYASWLNIKPDNTSVGHVFHATCTGLINNLKEMFPLELLRNELGIKRIVGTGNALCRNPLLMKQLETQFELPVMFNKANDAALGASLFVRDFLMKKQ